MTVVRSIIRSMVTPPLVRTVFGDASLYGDDMVLAAQQQGEDTQGLYDATAQRNRNRRVTARYF